MSDTATTETPTTPTEGSTSTEAAATTLLTSTETADTTTATASETTKEGDKPADGDKPAEETKVEGAPEKYEFKASDGKEFDAAVLEPFAEAAKEANLTQDAAQKIVDKMAPAIAARQQEQITAVRTGWLEATKSDKEFGGEQLPQNLALAKKALDAFDPLPAKSATNPAPSTEFRKLLETTGLGNNPEVIRILYRAGKAISEDGFVTGSAKPGTQKTAAEILYDNTPK